VFADGFPDEKPCLLCQIVVMEGKPEVPISGICGVGKVEDLLEE
jgi:hypothetical protein